MNNKQDEFGSISYISGRCLVIHPDFWTKSSLYIAGISNNNINIVDHNNLDNVSISTTNIKSDNIINNNSSSAFITDVNKGLNYKDNSSQFKLQEAVGLAEAIDLDVRKAEIIKIRKITPASFFTSGKIEQLGKIIDEMKIELIIINYNITPVQQRNLERKLKVKIIDRTGIILEIFGMRAKTKEGRLQVRLAHLTYQKSRLVRTWTHLERQRGGLGFVGGPGETQIEADRRIIQEQINKIKKQLKTVRRTRELHRKVRRKTPYFIVALVGYTNAGKSTLFNQLTSEDILAKDMLFATLDPTMRKLELPNGHDIIISDTVGFIADLPVGLVEAFSATLEEVLEADIILHVRDISNRESLQQAKEVYKVLGDLGVNCDANNIIEVWNKIDLIDRQDINISLLRSQNISKPVLLSARTKEGIKDLLHVLVNEISVDSYEYEFHITNNKGKEINWLYENCEVVRKQFTDDAKIEFKVKVRGEMTKQFEQMFQKELGDN